ncbi:MAG: prepilin-type N-terminal cleavage/methylation domain-containing protein [Eggerthellaceae bacterium]|nr:prepilin-type N-terminal cleavage/methylation domain-containing protein [Eggerthellaceae bacterium]
MSTSILKRLQAKLRSQGGFTLTEALVTLIIAGIVIAAASTGLAFATRQYSGSMEVSQAKVLQSTLKTVIENELSNTENVELGEKVANAGAGGPYTVSTFMGLNYGETGSYGMLSAYDSSIPSHLDQEVSNGEIAYKFVDPTTNAVTWKPLLGKKAYPEGLTASVDVKYFSGLNALGDPDESSPQRFRVILTIYDSSDKALLTDEFDVVPYNHIDDGLSA